MASIFDEGRFFLEVQANGLPEQKEVNHLLKELGQELSIPLVATNDCHYLEQGRCRSPRRPALHSDGQVRWRIRSVSSSPPTSSTSSPEGDGGASGGFPRGPRQHPRVARLCEYQMEFGQYKYPVFSSSDPTRR